MDAFSYLSVLISIVVGLALASPLTGFAAMVRARARVAMYWPLAAQMILVFLGQVQLWWALFSLREGGEVIAWPIGCVKKGGCSEIWKGFTDDPLVTSSPMVVNGKIYIGGSDHGFGGRIYVYGLPN